MNLSAKSVNLTSKNSPKFEFGKNFTQKFTAKFTQIFAAASAKFLPNFLVKFTQKFTRNFAEKFSLRTKKDKTMKSILRAALSGFLFALFGAFCLCGNLIFAPIALLNLQRKKPVRDFARSLVYHSWGLFVKMTQILGYLSCDFKGVSRTLTPSRLIIANHPSLLDVVLFLAHIKGLNCVVKRDLKRNFFLAPAIIASDYISNESDEIMLEKCQNALKNGESLLIFPEGTRTRDKIVLHKVASYLAINAAQSLECVFISCEPRTLQKGRKWFDAPKTRVRYTLTSKEVLDLQGFCADKPSPLRVRILHKKLQENYERSFNE